MNLLPKEIRREIILLFIDTPKNFYNISLVCKEFWDICKDLSNKKRKEFLIKEETDFCLYYKLPNGKLEGRYLDFGDNKQILEECFYIDGEKNGIQTKFYDSGKVESKTEFKGGKMDGLYERWEENGIKNMEYNHRYGNYHGKCQTWTEYGNISTIFYYKDGIPDGIQSLHYGDGSIFMEITYKNGVQIKNVEYKKNGEKFVEHIYDDEGKLKDFILY